MKNKILITILLIMCVMTTGCFKRDNMEDINIITTAYPIEFVTNKLYGDNANVNSIYPDGTNINEYKLNNKQLNDYSKQDLFIYLGLSKDKDTAVSLINKNNDLLIIDAAFGMEIKYGIEELWLNPSNLLMMSQNIKNGLQEYINSSYLNKEIDKRYEELKVELSELDAEIKLTYENAGNKTIIVANDVLRFLEKYGFTVLSLDPDTTTDKTLYDVQELINSGSNKYIFLLENDPENEYVKSIQQNTIAETLTLKNLANITDEERNNSEDYAKIMRENLEQIKKETYN